MLHPWLNIGIVVLVAGGVHAGVGLDSIEPIRIIIDILPGPVVCSPAIDVTTRCEPHRLALEPLVPWGLADLPSSLVQDLADLSAAIEDLGWEASEVDLG